MHGFMPNHAPYCFAIVYSASCAVVSIDEIAVQEVGFCFSGGWVMRDKQEPVWRDVYSFWVAQVGQLLLGLLPVRVNPFGYHTGSSGRILASREGEHCCSQKKSHPIACAQVAARMSMVKVRTIPMIITKSSLSLQSMGYSGHSCLQ